MAEYEIPLRCSTHGVLLDLFDYQCPDCPVGVWCMVCGATVALDAPNAVVKTLPHPAPLFMRAEIAAREHDWAIGNGEYGILLCCPDCYPKAFDTSEGNVGRAKPEYMKFAHQWRDAK